MKTTTLLCLSLIAVSISACAQKKSVPKEVTDAFSNKFPTAKSVKWDKENETEWEAEFKMDKVEYSANFLVDGTWQETEHEINLSQVPENVKTALNNEYKDYDIKEVEISETASGMVYEFAIKKGENKMEIAIDNQGTIVKKEVNSEDQDEDDEN